MLGKLMKMEERIVLDAAPATAADPADASTNENTSADHTDSANSGQTGAGEEASTSQTTNAPAGQDADNSSARTADTNAATAPAANGEYNSLLLVSNNLDHYQTLVSSAADGVAVLVYDADNDSLEDILTQIRQTFAGETFGSIAIASHGGTNGEISLTDGILVDAQSLTTDAGQQEFFTALGSLLDGGGRLDILSCFSAAGNAGADLISQLETLTGHDVAGSSDATGNSASGGDWILENGNIDASAYFTSALSGYQSVLSSSSGESITWAVTTLDDELDDFFTTTDDLNGNFVEDGEEHCAYLAANYTAILACPDNLDYVDYIDQMNDLSLREAIYLARSGDTVTFTGAAEYGTISLAAGYGAFSIADKDLTIDGDLNDDGIADMTLDGGSAEQIMAVSGANEVKLDGIFFWHGTSNTGGAVQVTGGATVSFSNCQFMNNTAYGLGGAVYADTTSALTFRNCEFHENFSYNNGGAIFVDGSELTVDSCSFESNNANGSGGILCADNAADIVLSDTTFFAGADACTHDAMYGGALAIMNSTLDLRSCAFSMFLVGHNDGTTDYVGNGGAVLLSNTTAVIDNCVFDDNSAFSGAAVFSKGGALYLYNCASVQITNSLIRNNSAGSGAGIFAEDTNLFLSSDYITSNYADDAQYGGGLFLKATQGDIRAVILNTQISDNTAGYGGGVYVCGDESLSLQVINSTIACNSAKIYVGGFQGGGLQMDSNCHAYILNSILLGNEAPDPDTNVQGSDITGYNHSNLEIYYSRIGSDISLINHYINDESMDNSTARTAAETYYNALPAQNGLIYGSADGTVVHTYIFRNYSYNGATVPYELPAYAPSAATSAVTAATAVYFADANANASGKYNFLTESLLFWLTDPDTGDGDASGYYALTDVVGGALALPLSAVRLSSSLGGAIRPETDAEMGAFQVETISDSLHITVTNDMDTTCSYDGISLREALASAASGATITFADRLYSQDGNAADIIISSTLNVDKAITITNGTGHAISISGGMVWDDTNGDGIGDTANTGTGCQIMSVGYFETTPEVFINNLSFINGNGGSGGALSIAYASVELYGCTFANNYASTGGAVSIGMAEVSLEDCTFLNNYASDGGAIYVADEALSLAGCTFLNNSATSSGGALYGFNVTLTVTGSIFSGNEADGGGGAVYLYSPTSASTFTGCVFSDNTAYGSNTDSGGGAVYGGGGTKVDFDTVIFSGNHAYNSGGAYWGTGGVQSFSDCIFRNNEAESGSGGALYIGSSILNITSALFEHNQSASNGGGLCLFGDEAVTIDRSVFLGNTSGGLGGGIYTGLAPEFYSGNISLGILNSVFSGNEAADGGGMYIGETSALLGAYLTITGNYACDTAETAGGGLQVEECASAILLNSILVGNTRCIELGEEIYSTTAADLYSSEVIQLYYCWIGTDGNPDSLLETGLDGNLLQPAVAGSAVLEEKDIAFLGTTIRLAVPEYDSAIAKMATSVYYDDYYTDDLLYSVALVPGDPDTIHSDQLLFYSNISNDYISLATGNHVPAATVAANSRYIAVNTDLTGTAREIPSSLGAVQAVADPDIDDPDTDDGGTTDTGQTILHISNDSTLVINNRGTRGEGDATGGLNRTTIGDLANALVSALLSQQGNPGGMGTGGFGLTGEVGADAGTGQAGDGAGAGGEGNVGGGGEGNAGGEGGPGNNGGGEGSVATIAGNVTIQAGSYVSSASLIQGQTVTPALVVDVVLSTSLGTYSGLLVAYNNQLVLISPSFAESVGQAGTQSIILSTLTLNSGSLLQSCQALLSLLSADAGTPADPALAAVGASGGAGATGAGGAEATADMVRECQQALLRSQGLALEANDMLQLVARNLTDFSDRIAENSFQAGLQKVLAANEKMAMQYEVLNGLLQHIQQERAAGHKLDARALSEFIAGLRQDAQAKAKLIVGNSDRASEDVMSQLVKRMQGSAGGDRTDLRDQVSQLLGSWQSQIGLSAPVQLQAAEAPLAQAAVPAAELVLQ